MAEEIVVTEAMRKAVRAEECRLQGRHDFDIVVSMEGEPTIVHCARCGEHWNVEER